MLRFLSRHTLALLAAPAELPRTRIAAAATASSLLDLDDLEKLARVFGVKVAERFEPVGGTAEDKPRGAQKPGSDPDVSPPDLFNTLLSLKTGDRHGFVCGSLTRAKSGGVTLLNAR